jgi:hypothetical protein
LESQKIEAKEEFQLSEDIKMKEEIEQKCEQEILTEKEELINKEIIIKKEENTENKVITETEICTEKDLNIKKEEIIAEEEIITEKENEEQITSENFLENLKSISEETLNEENVDINMEKNDLEIPDTMEIIQVSEVLSPKLIDEPVIEENNLSSPPITQEIVPEEIKPRSPSPVSTITCSIDGNNDTEWNVPVAPAMGTIKINISQKNTPVNKPIIHNEDSSTEPQSPPDFTQTFGEIDPDQPPPPGLEMETVVAPKIQREMKPRLMHNSKKLKDYPMVNRGKEMSGLCSIM